MERENVGRGGKARALRVPVALAVLGLAAFAAGGRGERAAESWEVRLTVAVRGEYGLEARERRTDGRFAFTAGWSGMIKRDDQDLFLLHRAVDLADWKAEERTSSGDRVELLATDDFPERPEIKVDYALRLPDGIHMSFFVRGFDVPVAPAPESFPLVLPASAENEARPVGLSYGPFVVEGTNAVVLDEAAMRSGPWEKEYRWSWKHRTWIQRQDQNVLETQAHSVVVKIVATPAER